MKVTDLPAGRNPDTPANNGPLLTTDEAARYLGVSKRMIQAEVSGGRLRKVSLARPGAARGPVRFRPCDLDAYVAERVVEPVPRGPRP